MNVSHVATVVDGTSATLPETLAWAFRCDLFVCVVGSGLVAVTWLADKPGVCYGDAGHMEQQEFWPSVRPPTGPVIWLDRSEIRDQEHVFNANYSIEPDTIVHHVRSLVARQLERAPYRS